MQSVYKLCTVSTNYTQVNVYVYSVHKPRTASTNYAQCPQTICMCVYVYACTSRTRICVYIYMRPRTYTYISDLLGPSAPQGGQTQ